MSGFAYPDLPKRFDHLKRAVAWAAEINTVWRDQDDGGIVRKANKPWVELRPRRIASIGVDEIRHQDLETPLTEGTLDWPRQELQVAWKEMFFEMRFRSRSQKHKSSAWYAGTRFQTRFRGTYPLQKWLKPMQFSIVNIGDVVNMPETKPFQDRVEDLAVIEFSLNALLCDADEANVGTWIDRCEVSSDITCLQVDANLDDVVMGWPDGTIVVDSEGTPVVDGNGNLVLEG
jgi:hypothetical protein